MKKFILNTVMFLANSCLAILLFAIVSAFTLKYTFMVPELNSSVVDLLPIKSIIEESISQETGVPFELNSNDEQVIKQTIKKFVFQLSDAVNKNLPLEINPKEEFLLIAQNLSDPQLKLMLNEQLLNNPEFSKEFEQNTQIHELVKKTSAINSGVNYFVYIYLFLAALTCAVMIAIDQPKALKKMSRTFLFSGLTVLSIGLFVFYVAMQQSVEFLVVIDLAKRAALAFVVFGILYLGIFLGLRHYLRHNYQN